MYTPEEMKILAGFVLFSLVGRMLFYREKCRGKTFGEKLKRRIISWVWEIPVLLFFGFSGLAIMERWNLSFTEAGLIALLMAYVGLEALKVFAYDWLAARWGRKEDRDD